MKLLLVASLVLFAMCGVSGHPIPTFLMSLSDMHGNIYPNQYLQNPMNLTAGILQRFYFVFQDMQFNNEIIILGNVMPMHNRMFHILIVSEDQQMTAHIHPDDFTNMTTASPNTTVFFVETTFPRAGIYSIAANFLYNDLKNKTWRDGFAQTEFAVGGPNLMDPLESHIPRNYNTINRFRTWNFTDVAEEKFLNWINTTSNYDANGYYAELQVFVNGTLNTVNNTNLINSDCTYFLVNVYTQKFGTRATMIPLMSAPVHFTAVNFDLAVYHAHGMWLDPSTTFPAVLKEIAATPMMSMMSPNAMMNDPMYNISMGANMIGITGVGTLDCFSDEGQVMKAMDVMGMPMDMNMFYGPSNFSQAASIFHFPNDGNWRIYAWMKMLLPDGEEVLFVPHFDVYVPPVYASVSSSSSAPSATSDSSVTSACVMFVVMCVLAVLF